MKLAGLLARNAHRLSADISSGAFRAYLLKASLGVAACYALMLAWPERGFLYSAVSVGLVLAPEDENAVRLALERIGANVAGAFIGWLAALMGLAPLASLALSVPATILLCSWLGLRNAARSALAGLVIVSAAGSSGNAGAAAFDRAFYVLIGCVVGLAITGASLGLRLARERLGLRRAGKTSGKALD